MTSRLAPLALLLAACSPAALAALEPGILALDSWACRELVAVTGSAIPAEACAGEEAFVKGEIDRAIASDAGVPSGTQRVVTRVKGGRRVCVGRLSAGPVGGKDGGM